MLDSSISSKLFIVDTFFTDDYVDENREDFNFQPREKDHIELGFVNEHVTFTDEESDHEDGEVNCNIDENISENCITGYSSNYIINI